jgi:DUF971 family protein
MLTVTRFILDQGQASVIVSFSSNNNKADHSFPFSFEFLRVFSPDSFSRYQRGKTDGDANNARKPPPLVSHKKCVKLLRIEPVAKYGYRFIFDDQHKAIYSTDHLLILSQQHDLLWQSYLDDLQSSGHSREASIDIKQL